MTSANLKIERATEHIAELNKLLREQPPFRYVVETDTKTNRRSMFAERDKTAINRAGILIGDCAHNLRSALDHVYWDITHGFAKSDGEIRNIQFPIPKTREALKEAARNGLPSRVGPKFTKAIIRINAHQENTGNKSLCFINAINRIDKHRLLIPLGEYKTVRREQITKVFPDAKLPAQVEFGMNNIDAVWSFRSNNNIDIGTPIPSINSTFKKQIDMPIEVFIQITESGYSGRLIPTLMSLADAATKTVRILKLAA